MNFLNDARRGTKKKEAKTQWLLNFRELRHLHFFPFSPFQSYFVCNLDILEGDSEMPYTGVQKYAIKCYEFESATDLLRRKM